MSDIATQERQDERVEHLPVTPSCGNIFADLDLPDPDILAAKADISIKIQFLMEAMGLNQTQAAGRMGVTQLAVSKILRGRLGGFSFDRLFRCLNALDQDVQITIVPRRAEQAEVRTAWEG